MFTSMRMLELFFTFLSKALLEVFRNYVNIAVVGFRLSCPWDTIAVVLDSGSTAGSFPPDLTLVC